MDASLSAVVSRAAAAIREAEVIVIGAGAGMGVDSGLPDFRGDQGFWKAYPPYERLGVSFEDAANPEHFKADPAFGWGFYGHRLALYRATVPHAGFGILRRWVTQRHVPFFVYTSNVDGQFQKAGFHPGAIAEIHGSIHHLQCTELCTEDIWANQESVEVDESTMRSRNVLRCPRCGAVARPNILMFGDLAWAPYRGFEQKKLFDAFLASNRGRRTVVIELGAGTAIPSVRRLSELIQASDRGTLVRVNPREPQGPDGTVSIAAGALEGLRAIDARLAELTGGHAAVETAAAPPARPKVPYTSLPQRPDLPCPAPGDDPLPHDDPPDTEPFLDQLFAFRLANGRRVSVRSFSTLTSNYATVLEGGMHPQENAEQREGVIAAAERRHGGPVIVIEPVITPLPRISRPGVPRERLPWVACMARLASSPLHEDHGDLDLPVASELTLVWWQDSFSLPLPAEIERAAASLDWDVHARDVPPSS